MRVVLSSDYCDYTWLPWPVWGIDHNDGCNIPSLRRILYHTNLRRPQRATLDHIPRLLTLQHRPWLLALHRRLEQRLVLVRIKLLPRRIERYHPVLCERLQEFLFCHFDTVEERDEVLVVFCDGLVDVL